MPLVQPMPTCLPSAVQARMPPVWAPAPPLTAQPPLTEQALPANPMYLACLVRLPMSPVTPTERPALHPDPLGAGPRVRIPWALARMATMLHSTTEAFQKVSVSTAYWRQMKRMCSKATSLSNMDRHSATIFTMAIMTAPMPQRRRFTTSVPIPIAYLAWEQIQQAVFTRNKVPAR